MCGIFSLLNNNNSFHIDFVERQFQEGKHRGRVDSRLSHAGIKIVMAQHNSENNSSSSDTIDSPISSVSSSSSSSISSAVPIVDKDIVLVCDGEIYNYHELYKYMNYPSTSENGETDVNGNANANANTNTNENTASINQYKIIIHLYRRYGIEQTLQLIDGVFSFILLDNTLKENCKVYVARDAYGVRPLYTLRPKLYSSPFNPLFTEREDLIYGFASEMKMLYGFYKELTNEKEKDKSKVKRGRSKKVSEVEPTNHKWELIPFEPGCYSVYELDFKAISSWKQVVDMRKYHTTGFNSNMYHTSIQYSESEIILNIQRYLIRAVEKMCSMAERPMACLLSGGLDSSIIAGLVRQYHITNNLPTLETYSIGMEGSMDMKYAKKVAEHLGTRHTEIIVKEEELTSIISEVIKMVETYDVATVRASLANYLLGKYISENSDARIIFNGDGCDEVLGGYLYMYLAYDSIEFDRESRRLLSDMHLYDGLRADKCMGAFGLSSYSPFLDRSFVQYYLSVPHQIRYHTINEQCEKYLLRLAFSSKYYRNSIDEKMIPDEILWRTKEEFTDGLSSKTNLFVNTLNEYTMNIFVRENILNMRKLKYEGNMFMEMVDNDPIMNHIGTHLLPTTPEQYIFRREFERHYPGMGEIVPYFWMPKYMKCTDPSARTLDIYDEEEDEEKKKEENATVNVNLKEEEDEDACKTIDINIQIS
jgi:asparagine synthase (glutamine-hydrolysing)